MPQPNDLMGYGLSPFVAGELGNDVASVTATGTSSTTAAAITQHITLVNAQSSQTGVILPAGAKIGTPWYIIGTGAQDAVIYPPASGTINNGASSLTLSAATATAILIRASTTAWYSFPLAP